ncbi:MAG: hypothetical protein KKD18_05875, partial [Nanoarchaeota archaeon]|nr:hypothetical protein [Nanoarchaeota archaeon]
MPIEIHTCRMFLRPYTDEDWREEDRRHSTPDRPKYILTIEGEDGIIHKAYDDASTLGMLASQMGHVGRSLQRASLDLNGIESGKNDEMARLKQAALDIANGHNASVQEYRGL